jgi:hypothetical protein
MIHSRDWLHKKGWAWKLTLLFHTKPVTELTAVVHGDLEALHVVWRHLCSQDGAQKVWVVIIATKHKPILLLSTDVTCTQPRSGS